MFKSLGLHKVLKAPTVGSPPKPSPVPTMASPAVPVTLGSLHFASSQVEGCESDPFQSDKTILFTAEFRLQAFETWFFSWLVESLSFRWVHAQQLRPLTVDVEPVPTEKKSTSARSCYIFSGLEPQYLDLLRYIFLYILISYNDQNHNYN